MTEVAGTKVTAIRLDNSIMTRNVSPFKKFRCPPEHKRVDRSEDKMADNELDDQPVPLILATSLTEQREKGYPSGVMPRQPITIK